MSLYQYDETSGYYYDPVTTLYYDANTTYYYNGNTGQFLYWDAEQSTYLPAPTGDEDPNKADQKEDKKEGKDKKEKVKVAKKIAKVTEEYLLQLTSHILNSDISKYPLTQRTQFRLISYFYLPLNFCYLKLLIFQSKFSGDKKVRYC